MKSYCLLFSLSLFLFAAGVASGYTREDVVQRGTLVCGVSQNVPGFAVMDEEGHWTGFDVDICRAVAAAVLGDAKKTTFVPMRSKGAYTALLSGKVDLLMLHQPDGVWDFTRDSALAVNFVTPSFYDEAGVLVNSSRNPAMIEGLDAVACIPESRKSAISFFLTQHRVKKEGLVFPSEQEAIRAFFQGKCEMLFGAASLLQGIAEEGAALFFPQKEVQVSFGPIVRQGDDNWFDIVRWSLFALLNAEKLGLSMDNVEGMRLSNNPAVRRFWGYEGAGGKSLGIADDWAAQIVIQVGNYGDIFARNLKESPRKHERGKNRLWLDGGLHCPPPLQ